MNNKTIFDELKKIEKDYNSMLIDRNTARLNALPLINAFNKRGQELADKYGQPPTTISLSRFSFGR